MEGLDPYEKRTACVVCWMLCARRIQINKDVAKIIAKMVFPLDLRATITWKDGSKNDLYFKSASGWMWHSMFIRNMPCNICLRPCLFFNDWYCPIHDKLTRRPCFGKCRTNSRGECIYNNCENCFETYHKDVLLP